MEAEPCGSRSAWAPPPRSLCMKNAQNKLWPSHVSRSCGKGSLTSSPNGPTLPRVEPLPWERGAARVRPGQPQRRGARGAEAALGSPGRAGRQVAGAGPALKGAIVSSYSWYAPGREAPGAARSGRESEGRRVRREEPPAPRGAAPPGRPAAPGVPGRRTARGARIPAAAERRPAPGRGRSAGRRPRGRRRRGQR